MRSAAVCCGLLAVAISMGGLAGCHHRYEVIPSQLQAKVNRQLTFEDIKRDPARYQGEMVVLGGKVLGATRLSDRTRIEILQTPLGSDFIPALPRSASQGRFIAFDMDGDGIDPAGIRQHTLVTILGEIQEPESERVGPNEYQYPVVAIRNMTIWDRVTWIHPAASLVPYWPFVPYDYYFYSFWSGTRVTS